MSRPILIKRWRASSGGVGVFRYLNGDVSQIGSNFGTAIGTSNDRIMQINAVAQWKNTLYCPHAGELYAYDVANSGDWDVLYDLANHDATANAFTGPIVPVNTNDEEQLVFPYVSSAASDQIKFVHVTETGIYETGPFTIVDTTLNLADGGNHAGVRSILVSNSNVYFLLSDGSDPGLFIYDAEAESLSETEITDHFANNSTPPELTVLDGVVYAMFIASDAFGPPNRSQYLFRVEGNSTVEVVALQEDDNASSGFGEEGQNCIFNDGTDVYCFTKNNVSSNSGWEAWRVQIGAGGAVTKTEITSTVFPTNIAESSASNNADNGDRWWKYVNLEDSPGGTPEILLAYGNLDNAPNIGESQISLYRWNGPTQQIAFIGAGGDAFTDAFPNDEYGGGHRTWSGSGELDSTLHLNTVNQTTIDLDLQVYGGGQSGVRAMIYFDRQGNRPTTLATLDSIIQGFASLSGNTITGLSPSGDLTRVRWSASLDGVQAGDTPRVVARTFRN